MNGIETYFQFGTIKIGSITDHVLCGTFQKKDSVFNDNFIVHSDRGFDHLLMMLAAKISANEDMEVVANEKYPYSRAIKGVTTFEQLLNSSYCEISCEGNLIKIILSSSKIPQMLEVVNSKRHYLPGIYSRIGSGSTVAAAVESVLSVKPFLLKEIL